MVRRVAFSVAPRSPFPVNGGVPPENMKIVLPEQLTRRVPHRIEIELARYATQTLLKRAHDARC
jgi:hypothetical protein